MNIDLEGAMAAWRSVLAENDLLFGATAEAEYGADTAATAAVVLAALRIRTSKQIPQVLKIAAAHRVPVYPISTGKNWGYGGSRPARDGCVILDLSALRTIIAFDATLGVVTVEPGVTQGMLAAFLEDGRHPFMVPVTGAGPNCSLVGNALERGFGITPYADHFAAVTDVEAVLADGTVFKTALREIAGDDLASLFKWGVGPYTAGLFSQGGFGVVTRLSIALARRPEAVMACLFSLRDDSQLEAAVTSIQNFLSIHHGVIGGINLMNQHRVLAMTAPYPAALVDPDGLIPAEVIAAMGRRYRIHPWTGFATIYGSRRVVAAVRKDFRDALRGPAMRFFSVSPQRAKTLAKLAPWVPGQLGRQLGSTTRTLQGALDLALGRPNDTALPLAYWRNPVAYRGPESDPARDGCGLIWYAPVIPMRAKPVRHYVEMMRRTMAAFRIEPLITLTSNGDRVFEGTTPLLFDRTDVAAAARAKRCYERLFTQGLSVGCAPYRLPCDQFDLLTARQSSSSATARRLKFALDPDGIISPGRYGL